ncbi:hypothetical protein [Methylobacterium pseudosasicola]|uniref:Uncharacterized protein n=1 Tax=Methylobacterium pseudosasicola TaxID=582667 RepID=A0A1I4N4E2_9HYPH|nr:hypothetical protein [Methylobacterium pseudosasicola]SFM10100.1 hypothetical protein SAMN05192568_101961 [Methylobacterium pseudosasicola]
MTVSTRRAALGAILAAPLTGGAVMALPSNVPQPTAPAVSPELVRLIAKHDRINAILNRETQTDDSSLPSYGTMRAARHARTRVTGFSSRSFADTLAKAACLGRLWPTDELAIEVGLKVRQTEVCMDEMALGLALELMRFAEGTLCA